MYLVHACLSVHVSHVWRSVCATAGCHRLNATTDPAHLLWVMGIKGIQCSVFDLQDNGELKEGRLV